ncbi:helix-turn-helix domain-containing protein [Chitinophaga ginsengisoli]|uniref:AraC-like DNA-binding protein n=1 Tax=Chitinophaga ginsengisoli TaxID=363837 RepID=A0A2P8G279_9BACT|nr:helix-turn-helix domain-containing protein [Chitinophaga ginsengisoli]PSL28088.1 AraC-like DNA-binding protein [Chitinophaga ginsengisoli]
MRLVVEPYALLEESAHPPVPGRIRRSSKRLPVTEYAKYSSGTIITQKLLNNFCSIYLYSIDAKQTMHLIIKSMEPKVVLQILLEANNTIEINERLYEGIKRLTATLIIVPKGTTRLRVKKDKVKLIYIELGFDLLNELSAEAEIFQRALNKLLYSNEILFDVIATEYLEDLLIYNFEQAIEYNYTHGNRNITFKSIIYSFLSHFLQSRQDKSELNASLPDIPHREKIMNIRDTIRSHPNLQTCRLENLSKEFLLSKQMIGQLFYQLFNIHISEFLSSQIMEKAVLMLTTTSIPIKEIAAELGYSASSNFVRAFYEIHNEYPADVRLNGKIGNRKTKKNN